MNSRTVILWTAERKEALHYHYPLGAQVETICAIVNAMPGDPIERHWISIKANEMGLRRPPDFQRVPGEAPRGSSEGIVRPAPAFERAFARPPVKAPQQAERGGGTFSMLGGTLQGRSG